jgi:hypothetical protein
MAESLGGAHEGSGNSLVDDALLLESAAKRKPLSANGIAAAKRIQATVKQPGGFGSGCTEMRHDWWKNCEHHLPSTFSAGPFGTQIRFRLPSGIRPGSDSSARFLAHLLALRALCLAGYGKTALVKDNLAALRRLPRLYDDYGGGYTPVILVAALKCLKFDSSPEALDAIERGMRALMSAKRPLGWADIPNSYVQELLAPSTASKRAKVEPKPKVVEKPAKKVAKKSTKTASKKKR